jgi:CRP-like cAMP-binding protein
MQQPMENEFRTQLMGELAAMPLFAGLTDRELSQVAGTVLERRVKAGKTIIKEGHWGHEFLLVLDGETEVRRGGQIVATNGPGSYVGELAVLDEVRRNATVVAKTAVVVGSIDAGSFSTLLVDIPILAERIAAAAGEYDSPSVPPS